MVKFISDDETRIGRLNDVIRRACWAFSTHK